MPEPACRQAQPFLPWASMPGRWLFKTEPTEYSFEDLVRDGRTTWDGVTNALAQKHLRQVRKGDSVLIYHTGSVKAVVGIARASADAYGDPKRAVVDLEPVRALRRPVTLASIRRNPRFTDFALVRTPRLSVMPVPDALWSELVEET